MCTVHLGIMNTGAFEEKGIFIEVVTPDRKLSVRRGLEMKDVRDLKDDTGIIRE